jgi:hypothetical protein
MTDKTPQNKAETPVNTPATLARTTDTARRALPQADALKSRFKAGSIPLQTDFADLIDLANIGRQAVGGAEGQTGPADGFTLSSGRLELKPKAGITVDSSGVGVKVAVNSGLTVDETDGLKIVPEQMFQKGMVMMFAGTEAEMPKGWALCDGNEGRPNLSDRFVLGSSGFTNVNQTNGKTVTGTNTDKQYMANSDAKTPIISVTVNNHTLTTNEIPAHTHYDGVRYNYDNGSYDIHDIKEFGLYNLERKGSTTSKYAKLQSYSDATSLNLRLVQSSVTGSSGGHNHTATATQASHQHQTNVVPPYYILAFIIKL